MGQQGPPGGRSPGLSAPSAHTTVLANLEGFRQLLGLRRTALPWLQRAGLRDPGACCERQGQGHGRRRAMSMGGSGRDPAHAAATQWPPSSTSRTRRAARPPDPFKCRLWCVPLSAEPVPTPVPEIQGSRRPSAVGKATCPPSNTSPRGPWLSREAEPGLCFLLCVRVCDNSTCALQGLQPRVPSSVPRRKPQTPTAVLLAETRPATLHLLHQPRARVSWDLDTDCLTRCSVIPQHQRLPL